MKNKEVKPQKIIAYVGNDPDFLQELEARFASDAAEVLCLHRPPGPGKLLEVAAEVLPNVIILDIPEGQLPATIEEIIFLKNIPNFKPIMLIGIFPDQESLNECPMIASSGLTFCYIKGHEHEHLFRDCELYGLEQRNSSPLFATARELKLRHEVNVVSTLAAISAEEILLDTDMCAPWVTNLPLRLNLFNDGVFRDYEVVEQESFSTLYPMTDRFRLKLPFRGPWDEETESKLNREVVTDILENSPDFDLRSDYVWIFAKAKFPHKLFLYSLNSHFHIEYKSLDRRRELPEHSWKKPATLFIELEKDDDDEHDHLAELIEKLRRTDDYKPVIFILNTKIPSEDLKVRHNYGNIIASKQELSYEFLIRAFTTLASNKKSIHQDIKFFKKTDINRCLYFKTQITITSLSEHEVGFELNCELPLFSLLQMDLAVPIYITITDLELIRENVFAYRASLHGMDETGHKKLRKIVNQLIYHPRKEITAEDVEKMLLMAPPEAETPAPEPLDEETVQTEKEVENAKQERSFSRAQKGMKSKL